MAPAFAISTTTPTVALDAKRKGEVSYTVSNTSDGKITGIVKVTAGDPQQEKWLSIDGSARRDLPVKGVEQFTVKIAVPADAPAGTCRLRLDVISADKRGEDEGAEGPWVTVQVPAPPKPVDVNGGIPWWIVAVGAGVLLLVVAVAWWLISSSAGFTYKDFASLAGLNKAGAAAATEKKLRLTPATQNLAGAVWFAEKQPVGSGFKTTFVFQMSGSTSPADGLAFVIQSKGPDAIGGGGGGLGYSGIRNSLAVEFDTWLNDSFEPGFGANHVSVQTSGTGPNTPSAASSRAHAAMATMADGKPHTVTITYRDNVLHVAADGLRLPDVPINLSTTLGLSDGKAFVGFTAATGLAVANHDIVSWSFEPL